VRTLLENPLYRMRARHIGAYSLRMGGASYGAALLEQFAATGKPVPRSAAAADPWRNIRNDAGMVSGLTPGLAPALTRKHA
jgi:hypothetical protein